MASTYFLPMCFLVALAIPAPLQAADTIRVCGVDVSIGISKAAAMEVLSSGCELRHLPVNNNSVDVWCLKSISRSSGAESKPGECFDTAEFINDKLLSVTKLISRSTGDAGAQIASFIFDFTKAAAERGDTVTITSRAEFEDQGWRFRFLNITAGGRVLILQTIQPVGISNAVSSIKLEEQLTGR